MEKKNTGVFFLRVAFLFNVSPVGCFVQSSVHGSLESSPSPENQGKYPLRGGMWLHQSITLAAGAAG